MATTSKTKKLRRNQLDRFFKENPRIFLSKAPKEGWVKEVRQALGMTMQDLGERLGVIKQRIDRIEKDEAAGKVTLKTLQETAEALNCEMVYFFVPKRQGLQATLEDQARLAAQKIVKATEHSMSLEKQDTSRDAQRELVEELAQEMIVNEDRKIWRSANESKKPRRRHST